MNKSTLDQMSLSQLAAMAQMIASLSDNDEGPASLVGVDETNWSEIQADYEKIARYASDRFGSLAFYEACQPKAYKASFKKSPKARKVLEWVFFSNNADQALEYAARKLEQEYFGEAQLLGVAETDDPRE